MLGPSTETRHGGRSVKVCRAISWYSLGTIITFRGRITAREYVGRLGNRVYPIIRTLLRNNDAVFQGDNAPIHTAGTLQSWLEEHEGELHHLHCAAQSSDFNITEPLWSVLETTGTDSHLQNLQSNLKPVFKENGIKIPLECVRNVYGYGGTQHHAHTEMRKVSDDRLCGLVVRVPAYRSRGPGLIPGATGFSEK
jgi:hypothetical protein